MSWVSSWWHKNTCPTFECHGASFMTWAKSFECHGFVRPCKPWLQVGQRSWFRSKSVEMKEEMSGLPRKKYTWASFINCATRDENREWRGPRKGKIKHGAGPKYTESENTAWRGTIRNGGGIFWLNTGRFTRDVICERVLDHERASGISKTNKEQRKRTGD